jgi:Na+/proline symporter/CheY-like chemotaxis protein
LLRTATVGIVAGAYFGALFAIASWGDAAGRLFLIGRARPLIYALGLAVYCTTWTYYGSVGIASKSWLDFVPIYVGPLLVFTFGRRLISRIAALAKAQNIVSVADFVSARYGKANKAAALVAMIAVLGIVPYIALQLKAISETLMLAVFAPQQFAPARAPAVLTLGVALLLALFAMAFGTRRVDAREHQDGLMLAIAVESLVKLFAFLVVGFFVVFVMFDGPIDLARKASAVPGVEAMLAARPNPAMFLTETLLSAFAVLMLPRQFHVTIVENRNARDIRTAAWLFPLYLVAINIFVVPLAIAGHATFAEGVIDRDMTVLGLPLNAGARAVTLLTMIGGLSAAAAMVIVSSIALSIMVSNDLVMPLLLRARRLESAGAGDFGAVVLLARRGAILIMLCLAFGYSRAAGAAALSSIGLLSFSAVAQIAPAFLGGLLWRRANARGAIAGLVAGAALWAYCLLAPSFAEFSPLIAHFVADGPFSVAMLRPENLFGAGLPPLVNGVVFSLAANVIAFVLFSLTRQSSAIERLQANAFVGRAPGPAAHAFRLWRASATIGELEATIARFLGAARARRALESFQADRGRAFDSAADADAPLVRHAEHLLASAIGASSSRLALSLLFRRRAMSGRAALQLIDEASAAIQSNRDLLQHALDQAPQGVTVFDRNLALAAWNRAFGELFDLPQEQLRLGVGLDEIVRFNAWRGAYGPGHPEDFVANRLESLINDEKPFRLRLQHSRRVIEIRSARLPDGGVVTTYTDVTPTVEAEEALAATNELLEQRVRERTEDLVRLNGELARATSLAEAASLSKTRFLAAASHDILQPLNAARLYATSLRDHGERASPAEQADLARNVDASLEAVEEILGALLDISRLDAGGTRPDLEDVAIGDVLRQLEIEFAPVARAKGLKLTFVASTAIVRSDRRLLSRLLQNLISNAIKYTARGRVLVGCRVRGDSLRIEVRDTGIGIAEPHQRIIFEEFERLDEGARIAPGLGLGLSIVERLARVLGHSIDLRSAPQMGSAFVVATPFVGRRPSTRSKNDVRRTTEIFEPLRGLCVVVIDNEPRVLDGMQTLLGKWGCDVVAALDAEAAKAGLRDRSVIPDAIIADYHLDVGDGLDAIGGLRDEFGAELSAILITADRTPEVQHAADIACTHVLRKPLKPAQLRALLMRARALAAAAE